MTKPTPHVSAFNTRAIHEGQPPCELTGAVMTPIHLSSTFKQSAPGVHQGYEYGRTDNPTRHAYEACMASLESGKQAFAFASGMATITTVLALLPKDSHLIASNDLYGGTFRLFTKINALTTGLQVSFIDLNDIDALNNALQPNTKMIWVETPSNPLLRITDLQKVAHFAKKHQLISVADNTFATPFLQRPLEKGFDIVLHSATKYLNGHSDVISGIAVLNDNASLIEHMAFLQNGMGAVAAPFDSYLIMRSLKTLPLRMERHCENAMHIAEALTHHPAIRTVTYPGLASHEGHAIAAQQMNGFGGMISLELKATLEQTATFLSSVTLFTLAESLGGVESLIEHPALMTHAAIPKEIREKEGISDSLVRLSIGIEDVDDLLYDIHQALECALHA